MNNPTLSSFALGSRMLLPMLFVVLLASCTGKSTPTEVSDEAPEELGTALYCYRDSCQHLTLSISVELPLGQDSASLHIRDSLIADFVDNVSYPGYIYADEDCQLKLFRGDWTDAQVVVDYYGRAVYEHLLAQAKADYEERCSYLDEDTEMTEEDKQSIRNDVPMWEYELTISKTTDADRFVVYECQIYSYYGGPHGGVVGSGPQTFDKASGRKISRFLRADATPYMQSLLRRGLLHYYAEMGDKMTDSELSGRLLIMGEEVPQPVRTPCPNITGDSLIFTYGQYEVACYADGMPTFSLPVKALVPYLTPEGKALLINEE